MTPCPSCWWAKRRTDGLSSETHSKPKSVCFTLIQSTHSKETHTTEVSALHNQFYANIRVSFCRGDGRISDLSVWMCTFCAKALRHRLVTDIRSYIVEIIASTCCTSQLETPPHHPSSPTPLLSPRNPIHVNVHAT